MIKASHCFKRLLITILLITSSIRVSAQIIPDSSLGPESSVVIPNQTVQNIPVTLLVGGAVRGKNLFHSFAEFNVNAGQGAYFANPTNISTILSRVTGGNPSNIRGILGVLGNADLFFINPNGIIFGPNATLDVNGSFIASTAESLSFEDGTIFSAKNPQATPLLTVSTPIGLNFSNNPGPIVVNGPGQNLADATVLPLINPFDSPLGLSARPNNTLALIGGDIIFEGGVVRSPGGRVELGSIGSGSVKLNRAPSGWSFNYANVSLFKDINLSQRALVDASGFTGGSITLRGRNISLNSGSTVLIQSFSNIPSGDIHVDATESVELNGIANDGRFADPILAQIFGAEDNARIASTFLTEGLGLGQGGDININTKRLIVKDGGQILPRTHGPGNAGSVNVNASTSIQVLDFSPEIPILFSNISSATFSSGNSGDITFSTDKLIATKGSQIGSATFGTGDGGDVTIFAKDITLQGVIPNLLTPASINAATFGPGKAGTLTINTERLSILDGGRLGTSTVSTGDAGSAFINATDFVLVSGTVPDSVNPSLIDSSANIIDPALREQLGVPAAPSGNAGNVSINTGKLIVNDGGLVSVKNEGPGNAGTLKISANSVLLDNQGQIAASTARGNGGNIELLVRNLLSLSNGGNITASALGSGSGGNISIKASTATLDSSTIDASALQGEGGNISLNLIDLLSLTNSGVIASTQGSGVGGNIEIKANNVFSKSSDIDASASLGSGGNLVLTLSDVLSLTDSNIVAATQGNEAGGEITIGANSIVSNTSSINASASQGSGGNIVLTLSDLLSLTDSNIISSSQGGSGGNITARARNAFLDASTINASAADGGGGNISLSLDDWLSLSNGSTITASATGTGPGGNIKIESDFIFLSRDSSISANAEQAEGGNITINALGIFPLDAAITATSQLGPQFSGTVQINTPGSDINQTDLERGPQPAVPKFTVACGTNSDGKTGTFQKSGTGGLPRNPSNVIETRDNPKTSAQSGTFTIEGVPSILDRETNEYIPLIEPQGWIENSDGTYSFVAEAVFAGTNQPTLISSRCIRAVPRNSNKL